MSSKLDNVINELKIISCNARSHLPLPDDELISQYEKNIGFNFSDDYKKVIKEVGNVFFGTIDLLSLTKDKKYSGELEQVLNDARTQGLPEDWLPICEDNGSYYCITPTGRIRYWTLDGHSEDSWPDLACWIKEVWIEGN